MHAFAACGAATISTDAIVHELLADPEVLELVRERWGERALSGDTVDRTKVAEIVFDERQELEWLEGVLFPRVAARVVAWRQGLDKAIERPELAVVEVPLLFESGTERFYDATVAIVADEEKCRERAGARGHALIDARSARQLPQEEKQRRADYVIENNGSLRELRERIAALVGTLTGTPGRDPGRDREP